MTGKTFKPRNSLTPLFALGFAACGGGGGGSSSAPQEPTPRGNGKGNQPPPFMLPDEVPLPLIYENYPTNKAVHDLTPQGQSSAEIELLADTADNDLFRLDETDGRIWWNASPDFEGHADSDGDGVYIIRLNHPHNAQGFTEIAVTVGDVAREVSAEQWLNEVDENDYFRYTYEQVKDILPDNDFVKYLLGSFAYALPADGPVIITWSLVLPTSDLRRSEHANFEGEAATISQAKIDGFRKNLEAALSEFEAAANLKFIEVADTAKTVGDLRIHIQADDTGGGAGSIEGGAATARIGADATYYVYVHELGHAFGLKHPFEDASVFQSRFEGFPYDPEFTRGDGSERSIMSYNFDWDTEGLQPADIAALQWLYGAPGTDFDGLQARLMEEGITPEIL